MASFPGNLSDPGKVKITVGQGFADQLEEVQKIISGKTNAAVTNEMKDLMSKSVEELVAGEAPEEITTLTVRGRDLVMPQSGHARAITILYACLYALKNEAVDKILASLDVRAQFKIGCSIHTQHLVHPGQPPQDVAPVAEEPTTKAEPKRNIILGKPALVRKPHATVILTDGDKPAAIGSVEVWDVRPNVHKVRLAISSDLVEVHEDGLIPVTSTQQLADATLAIASRK